MSREKPSRPKLPPWIRVRVSRGGGRENVKEILSRHRLHTVCESAQCPNLGECWHRHTATFMILGDHCTRNCRFCAVRHAPEPPPPAPEEPVNLAAAAKEMNLKYVVVTSVTRDDLPDGGAGHFAAVVSELRAAIPTVKTEVLTPDFQGAPAALKTVIDAGPTVFNHNVETVERLSGEIRERADYRLSLKVLNMAANLADGRVPVKSGVMVGLGETDEEVERTIRDLREAGASLLTIGQYLPPSNQHWPVRRYVEPATFERWKELALAEGFSFVASAPLVRSSYNAEELFAAAEEGNKDHPHHG